MLVFFSAASKREPKSDDEDEPSPKKAKKDVKKDKKEAKKDKKEVSCGPAFFWSWGRGLFARIYPVSPSPLAIATLFDLSTAPARAR